MNILTLHALSEDPEGILTFLEDPTENKLLRKFQKEALKFLCDYPEIFPSVRICVNDWFFVDIISKQYYPGTKFHLFKNGDKIFVMRKISRHMLVALVC